MKIFNLKYIIIIILIIIGGYETFLGLSQLYRFTESNHCLYTLTGSFYNPGPYMGFLAMIFPICLHEYLKWKDVCKGLMYFSSIIVGLGILCILPAGMSRSAWISIIIASCYVIWVHYKKTIKQFFVLHVKWIKTTIISISFILMMVIASLYIWKKDSADGRLFIWKISICAISEKPWKGYGWDNVSGAYGDAQEAYFASGNYTDTEAYVAGSPEYMFNEYLQIAMAWGIPILVIGLFLIGYSAWIGHFYKEYGMCGALLSFAVFAFFSYPLQFPLFIFSLGLLIIGCIVNNINNMPIQLCRFNIIISLAVLYMGYCYYKDYSCKHKDQEKWGHCRILYYSKAYEDALDGYNEIYDNMKWNAQFLYELGYIYHKLHWYEESNCVLKQALMKSSNSMILNIIGKNYQKMKRYKESEFWLLRSINRIPKRIYPYYLLMRLYMEADCFSIGKLEWAWNSVLVKKPKVCSKATEEMKHEVWSIFGDDFNWDN